MRKSGWIHWLTVLLLGVGALAACRQGAETPQASNELQVVATTTIVGDVVAQVGGDQIELTLLLPVGTDPHSFEPSPQDIARVAGAQVVFANGAGLEPFLDNLLDSAGALDRVVYVSEGVAHRASDEHADHDHAEMDPHTWMDPNNVMIWVQRIEEALSEADPAHAAEYHRNAENYLADLKELDAWIRQQTARVPLENRKLVTDHALFGYFADTYGFEQIGALVPGFSSIAEPSAQDLAKIEDAIRAYGVEAVFVGNTVNPTLAERVAEDTGVELVFVYTGSLGEPGGEAGSYLDYMRYNVTAFVNALIP